MTDQLKPSSVTISARVKFVLAAICSFLVNAGLNVAFLRLGNAWFLILIANAFLVTWLYATRRNAYAAGLLVGYVALVVLAIAILLVVLRSLGGFY